MQPLALAGCDKARVEAEAHRFRRKALAEAEAYQYAKRLEAFAKSPTVFRSRLYLDSLRDALAGTRKFIVDSPGGGEVLTFDFQEKAFPDLFDLAPAPGVTEEKP